MKNKKITPPEYEKNMACERCGGKFLVKTWTKHPIYCPSTQCPFCDKTNYIEFIKGE